jgi:hypothetical protein
MPIVMRANQFFGSVVSSAVWEPFRIAETRYAQGAFLPWHRHEESYLTFVLAGGYRERSHARTRVCDARSLVLHPPGDSHEDDFAQSPTRCLNVVIGADFTSRLGEAAAPLHRGDVIAGPHVTGVAARIAGAGRSVAKPMTIAGRRPGWPRPTR